MAQEVIHARGRRRLLLLMTLGVIAAVPLAGRGAIGTAVNTVRAEGHKVARAHIMHLNPLPPDLGDILRRYKKVLVPEMNTGQLTHVVRAEFLVDAECVSKVQGQPFTGGELAARILSTLAALETNR